MEILLPVLVVLVLVAVGFAVFAKRNDDSTLKLLNENFNERMKDIVQQFQEQTKQMNMRLRESSEMVQKSNKVVGERLDTAAKSYATVTERLGNVEAATRRVEDVGKDIASLQDILRAPKLRGTLGEFFLGDLLSQYFPKDQFSMPYTFRSGEKVDAALHLADNRIVPIDAKFPLENFKKMIETKDEKERKQFQKAFISDVKRRIDEISKYIVPDEGTMDFALLYIPAENVYYEVIVKDEGDDSLAAYSFEKRVIPVSPNNFFVYLQTILMGLRGLKIEESAKEIQKALVRLKGDFGKFGEDFEVLGSHLTHAGQKFDEGKRRLEKIEGKIENIELLGSKKEEKLLAE